MCVCVCIGGSFQDKWNTRVLLPGSLFSSPKINFQARKIYSTFLSPSPSSLHARSNVGIAKLMDSSFVSNREIVNFALRANLFFLLLSSFLPSFLFPLHLVLEKFYPSTTIE